MAAKKYVQALTQYLAGSGTIVGATSIVLTSLTDIYANAITSITSFGDKGYITLEPDTTNEEAATFTTVTANANGTVTLGGVSTSLAQSPYTETSGLVRAHSGGTKVVITDNVAFWNTFANKNNAETITGAWQVPTGGTGTQVANATDIANAVSGASGTATETVFGTVKLSVAAVSAPTPVTVGDNDPRVPTQSENDAFAGTSGTPSSSNKYVTSDDVSDAAVSGKIVRATGTALPALDGSNLTGMAEIRFGGTGADGVLALTSGATNIDLGSAAIVTKNYTSISITGTGSLTFTNPNTNGTIVILKSQGNVTLTSSAAPMIDASGLGAVGSAGGTDTAGSAARYYSGTIAPGGGANGTTGGTGGTGTGYDYRPHGLASHFIRVAPGGGGSGGNGGSNNDGGAGGRGGGGLLVECAGAWNFTTASGLSVAGAVGSAVENTGGGGGGGGGGTLFVLYNTLTANSGTVTIAGGTGGAGALGAGGAGGNGTSGSGTGGSSGYSGSASVGGGGAGGASDGVGTNGSDGAGSGGGGGASGNSLITANVWFS